MRQRIERAERQSGARLAFGVVARDQDRRLAILHRHDRGGEADLNRCQRRIGHGYSRSSRNGSVA
jgi:hypothetical protein